MVFNLYRLDDKNRFILVDSKNSLKELCKEHEIPGSDIDFSLRVCNGEFAYNNFLITAEKEKNLDNEDEN